jgi:hypothetical protein
MRVPRVTPQVQSAPLGAPRADYDFRGTSGEQVGAGLRQLGAGVTNAAGVGGDIVAQERDKTDKAVTTEAFTELQKEGNAALYDGEEGYLTAKKGADALDTKPVLDRLEKKQKEIDERLTSDRQRKAFKAAASEWMLGVNRQVNVHYAQQNDAHRLALAEDGADTAATAAVAGYKDDVAREDAIKSGMMALLKNAPKDAAVAAAKKWQANTVGSVLEQFIAAGDVKGAEAYYGATRDVLGAKAAKYEALITETRHRKEADQRVNGIADGARKPNGFIDENKAMADFRALPEEQRTRQAEQDLGLMLQQEATREKAQKVDHFEQALTSFNKRHSLRDIDPQTEQWIRENDPTKWSALEDEQASWLARWRSGKEGRQPKTKQQVDAYATLLLDMSRQPEAFLKMDVPGFSHDYWGQLSSDDYESGLAHLARLKEAKPGAGPKAGVEPLTVARDLFRNEFKLKPDEANWSSEQLSAYGRVVDHVTEEERAFRASNPNKAPTVEQYQQWTREKLVKGTVPGTGGWFSSDIEKTRAEYETDPTIKDKGFVEEGVPDPGSLPDEGIVAARRIFDARGAKDTPQNYRDLFSAVLPGLREALGREPTMDELAAYLRRIAPRPKAEPTNRDEPAPYYLRQGN